MTSDKVKTSNCPRVLVGQIFQEAHGFTPLPTTLESFVIETGDQVLTANEEADSVLGGIIRTGRRKGWQLLPTIAARASPGGRVTDAAYAFIKAHLVEAAQRGGYDAIALCLHGCIQTQSLDSAETDLLASLRAAAGPGVPIVAGFDLHAHAGGGMLAHLDFATAYRTNPHADAGVTGERLGAVLSRMLETGLRPVAAALTVPMLTRGNDETAHGPLKRLHALARTCIAADDRLLDASIFNVNPFIDGKGVGQTVIVYACDETGFCAATRLAEALGDGLWAARDEFQHELPTLAEVWEGVAGKLIVGDFGDRVLAGAPGDSIHVVKEIRQTSPDARIVAPVTDAGAVDACRTAGVGQRIVLRLGGGHTPDAENLTLAGVVLAVGEGTFRNRGAFMRGAILRIGPFAVFESKNAVFLITQQPLMSQDPGCFLDCGIDLALADVIVAKSGYHFKLAFSELGACICVATPGLTTFDPFAFRIEKARPLYPLDEFDYVARADRPKA